LQVGRTGRAGKRGRVTSLYMPEQAVLAEAIRNAVQAGQPVEGAFSRNRSFSKKVKKYGKYVPRGKVQHAA
jgi:superfamily II DNA/RNA helicase